MRLAGQDFTQIAEHFGCSERTIHRLWLKYRSTGQTRDLPRSGRPQVTDLRQKRRIIRTHKMHTFTSASETARNFEISASTCRRILKQANLKRRRPFRGPILKVRHKRARLEWCRSCVDWSQEDWSRVLFSDECRFSLDSDDGRARVWRTNGSRLHPKNIMQHDRWRSKIVMV